MSDSDFESFIARQAKLEKLLVDYEAFMLTDMYQQYVFSRRVEIENIRADIVDNVPTDRASEIESYKRRGDLRTNIEFLSIFEDTAADLKLRLREMDEAANPTQPQQLTKEDDDEEEIQTHDV